ncbi:MAG: GtrA family protein [Rickettsiales bacterium]|nr:GtrA family protein [Rickettsiales bacterium]
MKQLISKILDLWFKIDRRIRFILVGGYNTVFSFALFCILQYYLGENLRPIWVLLITHIISIFNSFLSLRIFVFASKNNLLREYLKVNMVYCGYFIINAFLLFSLNDLLHLDVILAQFLSVLILTIGAYFAHKHFSFKS